MIGRARGLLRDERGVMLPIIALSTVALIGATSLTVDIGRLANRQRELQAIADVVALDAAGALVGADLPSLVAGDFDETLVDAAERNGVRMESAPETGHVTAGPDDFVATSDPAQVNAWRLDGSQDTELVAVAGVLDGTGAFQPMAVPASPTDAVGAVAVWAGDEIDYVFGVGRALTDRSGVAEALATGGVGMWASLASIDAPDGGPRLVRLLGRFLDVDASVISPDGIATASVSLGKLATELGFGSVDELLSSEVSLRRLLQAQADVLTADDAATATAVSSMLGSLATAVDGTATVTLGRIITIDQYGGAAASSAQLDVVGLLTATAMLVERGTADDPPHAIALDGTVLGMPVSLTVIEPPVFAFGPEGTSVETAQISLTFDRVLSLDTGPLTQEQCVLNALLPLLPCVPTLVEVLRLTGTGTSTISVAVAGGTTLLDRLTCSPTGHTAALDVTSSAVSVDAPLAIPLNATGVLGAVAGGTITGGATASSMGTTHEDVPFGSGTGQHAFDVPVHLDGGSTPVALDVAGTNIDLTAAVLGVSLSSGTAVGAVGSALTQALAPVNAEIMDLLSKLDVLGLGIGGADVVAVTPRCDIARLVA